MNSSTSNSEGRGYAGVWLATVACCLAAWLSLTLPLRGLATPDTKSLRALWEAKIAALQAKPGRRVILAGPSNVLFSLRAGRMEQALGRPVCNLGLVAPMTDAYLWRELERLARPGDAVIWAGACPGWLERKEMTLPLAGYLRAYDPGYVSRLSWRSQACYAMGWPLWAGDSDMGIFESWLLRGRPLRDRLSRHMAEYVDAHGDLREEFYREHLRRGGRWGAEARTGETMDFHGYPGRAALEAFSRWRLQMRGRGVEVAVTWPSMTRQFPGGGEKFRAAQTRLEKFLRSEGVVILGRPGDFFLRPEEVFDSAFHALPEGRERLTRRLVEACREEGFPAGVGTGPGGT
jgi:hypothetical protein